MINYLRWRMVLNNYSRSPLNRALKDAEVAAQQARAQEQRNSQVTSELESIRELVDVLGADGYNVYQAIKDGKVSILPIPQGTNITIPTS